MVMGEQCLMKLVKKPLDIHHLTEILHHFSCLVYMARVIHVNCRQVIDKLEDFLSLFDKIGMTMIGKLDLHKLYFNFFCTCRHNILYLVIDYEKNIIGKRQQYRTFYFFIFGATGIL